MPRSAAAANDGRLTPDRARELAKRRWQHDSQGLDEYIDRIVKRAPELTSAQREKLALLLHPGGGDRAASLCRTPPPAGGRRPGRGERHCHGNRHGRLAAAGRAQQGDR